MTSLLPAILFGALTLLLAIAMITAAVIAHRGKSFWGTWMMLIGAIGMTLGTIAAVTASILLFQNFSSSPSMGSRSTSSLATFSLISGIGSLLTAASLVLYLIGILGLAIRYGAVAKRVDDLETINASLLSQKEQSAG